MYWIILVIGIALVLIATQELCQQRRANIDNPFGYLADLFYGKDK